MSLLLKKTDKILTVFGLFFDCKFTLVRKKIKIEYYSNFRLENLTALLAHDNYETYYQNKFEGFEFLGVEIRFNDNLSSWLDKDALISQILKGIREEKKNLFKENAKK